MQKIDMNEPSALRADLPPEQRVLRARCFHPSGRFREFSKEEIRQSLVLFDTQAWSFGSYIWRRLNENRHYRQRFGLRRWRYRTPWMWNYFRARTRLHLDALRQLKGSERWRYFRIKAAHVATAVSYSLQRPSSLNPQSATLSRGKHTTDDLDPAEKNYYLASHRHRFRRHDGKIVLLVNEEWHASDPTLGWDKFAAGGLDVYKIPGNHDNCIPDNIPLVAEFLRACLAKADAASN